MSLPYARRVSTSSEWDVDRGNRGALVDWHGVGDVVSMATDRVTTPVEGVHRAIAGRWMALGGRAIGPGKRVVDRLIASAYGGIRSGGSVIGSTISTLAESASEHMPLPPVWETDKGRYVQSILNGVWGDELDRNASPASIELGLRDHDGQPIPAAARSLRRAFPEASSRLAVLIHGLGETERFWRSPDRTTLAEGLEEDGFTVLFLRYNSGRTVRSNGSALADLLEAVVSEWPRTVEEVVLVGHSMGGLIARSAAVSGTAAGHEWVDAASHVVGIGTPHLGTPIEKTVHGISEALGLVDETRPIASLLDTRSAGIKDLRTGVDDRPKDLQLHAIAGTVTSDPTQIAGALLGDMVVRVSSALDQPRNSRHPSSSVLVLGGRNHANLAHDPEAITHTRSLLTPAT